jgi:hypothetical protein
MFSGRAPPWFRDDPTIKTINDETEDVIIDSYFGLEEVFPKQPLQIWPTFNRKEYSFSKTFWNGNNTNSIDLEGSYPLNYNFKISTGDTTINSPSFIVSKESSLKILDSLPQNSIININTQKDILIDDDELYSINDQEQNSYGALIEFGKTYGNHYLKQEFVPSEHGLKEIEIMFGETVGNPTDNIIVSILLNETVICSKEVANEVINNTKNTPLRIGFKENLIAGKKYEIKIERTGDINLNNYYHMCGSLSLYSNGTLYGYNDGIFDIVTAKEKVGNIWEEGEVSLYFITRVHPLFFLRNLGAHEDFFKYNIDFTEDSFFESKEIIFGETIGNPSGNIVIDLYEGETFLEKVLLTNEEILESIGGTLLVKFSNKYYQGDYSLFIYPKELPDSENFYTLVTFEDLYPSYYPPLDTISFYCKNCSQNFMQEAHGIKIEGLSVGVDLKAIYVRAFSMGIYPLKKIEVFIKKGKSWDMIEEANFDKTLQQQCFFGEILKENINTSIDVLPFEMYANVEYWGLQESKTIVFPANDKTESNLNIDEIAKPFGIVRRNYKENIPFHDYAYTYPIGYPWEIEQDYWYEKRILDEYPTRLDKNEKVIIYTKHQEDVEDIPLLELRTKSPDIHNIEININEIGLYCEDLCLDEIIQDIIIIDRDIQGIIKTEETFTYSGDIIELMDNINYESEVLEATYLNNTHEALEIGTLLLNTEGTCQNYGLIKSEINQYLGVIPKIKDMSDYCLIWDEKIWDRYVWAGDKWDAGVFELLIPIDKIPKNFKLLSIDEIQQIVDKCKAFGTRALPIYTLERLIRTEFETEFEYSELILDLPKIEFESMQADMYASVFAQFNVKYNGVEGDHNAEFGIGFNIEFEVARLIEQTLNLLEGVDNYTFHSMGYVDLSAGTYTDEHFPTSGWSEGGGFAWGNPNGITVANDDNVAYAYAGSVGTTAKLKGICYPQVPSDALITGLSVCVHYANQSTYRSPYFNYCTHSMRIWNNDLGWHKQQQTYQGGGGHYNAWFGEWAGLGGWSNPLPTNPSAYNQGVGFEYDATLDKNKTTIVDHMYLVLWFKRGSGNYISTRIVTPELPAGYDLGYWDSIVCTEENPSGTNITYDVFEDIVDRQQTTSNANQAFGQGLYTEVYQSFVPTTSWFTGAWVKAGNPAKIGNPSGDVRITLRTPNSIGENILALTVVPKEEWINNAEIFVPFNINLTPGTTYWLCWWATAADNNNYFQMAYKNQALYGQMGVAESGIGWHTINGGNASAWFKTLRGNNLLTNKTSPINISTLPFKDLRLNVKMTTNNPGTVPKLVKVLANAKVINL